MPDTPKEEFPGWLVESLQCPVCHEPLALSTSGGSVCLKVPAHTGLICKNITATKIVSAWKLALGRELTTWSEAKARVKGRRYLKQNLLWRSKR